MTRDERIILFLSSVGDAALPGRNLSNMLDVTGDGFVTMAGFYAHMAGMEDRGEVVGFNVATTIDGQVCHLRHYRLPPWPHRTRM